MRAVKQVLAHTRAVVDPALLSAIDSLPAEVSLVAGYHVGLWDAHRRPNAPTGKALRPALALACTRAVGGPAAEASAAATAVAVAVELMHDFSLLHDDVMDGDLTRRHRPAAWAVFGVPRAVLTGDALLALALAQVAGAERQVLVDTLVRLCRGQGAELSDVARSDEVSLADCVAVAQDKTGALLGAACELGALAAGAPEQSAAHYREFGEQLGVAFQLVDDLLGIWGDEARIGKPARADVVTQKVTLPVVAALAGDSVAAKQLKELYRHDDKVESTGRAIDEIVHLIESAGGRAWAQEEAERRVESALRSLDHARPDPAAAEDLRLLADLVTHRDH